MPILIENNIKQHSYTSSMNFLPLVGLFGLAMMLLLPGMYSEVFAQSILCADETISTGTFESITVVAGTSCTITGDVIIMGNLKANGAVDVIVDGTPQVTIGNNVLITNSLGEININNANISGKLVINNNSGDSIFVTSNSIGKDFVMKNNDTRDELPIMDRIIIIDENIINGDIIFKNNFAEDDFFVRTNTISGNVIQTGTEVENNDIVYEENIIDGKINFKENYASGVIEFIRNQIDGNVNIVRNTTDQEFFIDKNTIGGKLLIKENGPEFVTVMITSNTLKNTTVDDNLGEIYTSSNIFDGTLKVTQNTGGLSAIFNSFTSGNLNIIDNGPGFFQILANSGSKNIIIKNNLSIFDFGIVQNSALNKIKIMNNVVGDETSTADLICHDNIPTPIGSENLVSGIKTDQCSLL